MDSVSQSLLAAQRKAEALFTAVVRNGMVRAGTSESELSAQIHALAEAEFGLRRMWHKRIARSGLFERTPDNARRFSIRHGNTQDLREPDDNGAARHWILEIHFIDRVRQIGGFLAELLTVDTGDAAAPSSGEIL